jgi:hypothetical protein
MARVAEREILLDFPTLRTGSIPFSNTDVPRALVRTASSLTSTLVRCADKFKSKCRDESRHGTQECVRYVDAWLGSAELEILLDRTTVPAGSMY